MASLASELDRELVDSGAVDATFRAGVLTHDQILEFIGRDQRLGIDGEPSVFIQDDNNGLLSVFTENLPPGTQEQVLQSAANRYVYSLGGLATKSRLVIARMNLVSIIDIFLEPYMPENIKTIVDVANASDEEWERLAESPEPPRLDVTKHMVKLLPA